MGDRKKISWSMNKLREAEPPAERDTDWFEGKPLKVGGDDEFLDSGGGSQPRMEPILSPAATPSRAEPAPAAREPSGRTASPGSGLNPGVARREPAVSDGSFSATRTPPRAAPETGFSTGRLVADERPAAPVAPAAAAQPAKARRAPVFGAALGSVSDTLALVVGAPLALLAVTLASVYLFPDDPALSSALAPEVLDPPADLTAPADQAAVFDRRTEPDETVTPPELANGAPKQGVTRAVDGLRRDAAPPFSLMIIEPEDGELTLPPAFSTISAPVPQAGLAIFAGVHDTLPERAPDATPWFPTVRAAPNKPRAPRDADLQPKAGAPDLSEQVVSETAEGAPIVHVAASLVNRVSDAAPSSPDFLGAPSRPHGPRAQETIDPLRSRAPFLPLDADPRALFGASFTAPRPFTGVAAAEPTRLAANPAPTADLERAPDSAPRKPSFSAPKLLVAATMGDIDSLAGIDRNSDPEPPAPDTLTDAAPEEGEVPVETGDMEPGEVETGDLTAAAATPDAEASEADELEEAASASAAAAPEAVVAETEEEPAETGGEPESAELVQAALQQDEPLEEDLTGVAPELAFRPSRRGVHGTALVKAVAGEAAPSKAPRPTPRW